MRHTVTRINCDARCASRNVQGQNSLDYHTHGGKSAGRCRCHGGTSPRNVGSNPRSTPRILPSTRKQSRDHVVEQLRRHLSGSEYEDHEIHERLDDKSATNKDTHVSCTLRKPEQHSIHDEFAYSQDASAGIHCGSVRRWKASLEKRTRITRTLVTTNRKRTTTALDTSELRRTYVVPRRYVAGEDVNGNSRSWDGAQCALAF